MIFKKSFKNGELKSQNLSEKKPLRAQIFRFFRYESRNKKYYICNIFLESYEFRPFFDRFSHISAQNVKFFMKAYGKRQFIVAHTVFELE